MYVAYLLVLRDNVGEQIGINLGVVAPLLKRHPVHLPSLDLGGLVRRINLQMPESTTPPPSRAQLNRPE